MEVYQITIHKKNIIISCTCFSPIKLLNQKLTQIDESQNTIIFINFRYCYFFFYIISSEVMTIQLWRKPQYLAVSDNTADHSAIGISLRHGMEKSFHNYRTITWISFLSIPIWACSYRNKACSPSKVKVTPSPSRSRTKIEVTKTGSRWECKQWVSGERANKIERKKIIKH